MPPIRDHQFLYTFIAEEDDEAEEKARVAADGGGHTTNQVGADAEDDDDDDDAGMPPLVERPTQESMMSSIDFSGMSFNPAPFVQPTLSSDVEDPSRNRRTGKAKSRAPSYIPRPPNAFILFRSSFIRTQNVPERVEGNHSQLSKIIGRYWKALPQEEKAKWEDKARAAQAEHRRRYPDWRFRPANDRSGKPKPQRRKGRIKDGGDDDDYEPPDDPGEPRGRRSARGRKPVARDDSEDGKRTRSRKGKGKEKAKEDDDDERCDKIAELLGEGKRGKALEEAVNEWEENGRVDVIVVPPKRQRGRKRAVSVDSQEDRDRDNGPHPPLSPHPQEPPASPLSPYESPYLHHLNAVPLSTSTSASPIPGPARAATNATELMPPPSLTQMHKRSLSAPCGDRAAYPAPLPPTFGQPNIPPPPLASSTSEGYPPAYGYIPPPALSPPAHRQTHPQPRPSRYARPPTARHGRRDTISLPIAVPNAIASGSGTDPYAYRAPPPPSTSTSTSTLTTTTPYAPYAYAYPSPSPPSYPTPPPGPPAQYGGLPRAQGWWTASRGHGHDFDFYADSPTEGPALDSVEEGWGDSGVTSFANYAPGPLPSPSPPPLSPYTELKPADRGAHNAPTGSSPDTRHFQFDAPHPHPPLTSVSSFSTLSGWAGSSPSPLSPSSGASPLSPGHVNARTRTSGWYTPASSGWDATAATGGPWGASYDSWGSGSGAGAGTGSSNDASGSR
ncbi:HMG box domain-containing protein [Mycena kentingensis (nom. inval.)]|nr:HMG box domain-containing protein [Mycena kentingensis (nom. inval.)]